MTIRIKGKTLLVLATGAGMVITAWMAAKKAPEAQKRKEEALQVKREATGDENAQLTFFESAKAQIGSYIPAIITGMFTIGGFVGSEIFNERNLCKAEKKFEDCKNMIEKFDGKGAVKTIEKAMEQKKIDDKNHKPWDIQEEFRIRFQGDSIQFKAKRSDVIEAFYEINRYFHGNGRATFNQLLEYLNQPSVAEGDDRGWESYIGDTIYGYSWIDFGLKECEDEPWITEIYMPVYPHFFDEDECEAEIDEGVGKLLSGDAKEADPPWDEGK